MALFVCTGALALSGTSASWASPARHPLTAGQKQALRAGIQVAPKAKSAKAQAKAVQINPYLANVPDVTKIDYSAWKRRATTKAAQRQSSTALKDAKVRAAGKALGAVLVHDEEEPAGSNGSNDSRLNAEPIPGFGTGAGDNPRVRILGDTADLAPAPTALARVKEDNGQLNRAGNTKINGVGAIRTKGVLGDGPHGTSGDQSNDFDFYKLKSTAGLAITVDTTESQEASDTVVAIYNAAGALLDANDDYFPGTRSKLSYPVTTTGTYYVLVAAFADEGPFPNDPRDSGSGTGGAETGPYVLTLTSAPFDSDFYGVDLAKGDVIGATAAGSATKLSVYRYDGERMVTADQVDASAAYSPESPLPGGGNTTLAYVAEKTARYAIRVDGDVGRYDANVEAYRPGSEIDPSTHVQTVFLDFDGSRVNTGIWGGAGVRELSPFSAFIAKWGISRSQESVLIDKITAGVQENIRQDLIARGSNPNVAVNVVSSRRSADVFGRTNVSRVIVGGTIEQSGIPTIGIAQYIDPGNYGHEDSALVLLDVLSGPADDDASLNRYLKPSSNRVAFVSQAVANVISHEIGHLVGSFHTDNLDAQHSLMDAGGANYQNLYGVGRDKVGGTADDEDVDFVTDTYAPEEGFAGRENTLNVTAWAFVKAKKAVSLRTDSH